MTPNPNYQSYLLRFWRDLPDQPWRTSLHCVASGEKFAFGEVRALFAFLAEQLLVDEQAAAQIGAPTGQTDPVADSSTADSSFLLPQE
jgi:hypothetical protein